MKDHTLVSELKSNHKDNFNGLKAEDFTECEEALIFLESLSPCVLKVCVHMLQLSKKAAVNKWTDVFRSQGNMAKDLELSRATVNRSLQKLFFLEKRTRSHKGRRTTNAYRIPKSFYLMLLKLERVGLFKNRCKDFKKELKRVLRMCFMWGSFDAYYEQMLTAQRSKNKSLTDHLSTNPSLKCYSAKAQNVTAYKSNYKNFIEELVPEKCKPFVLQTLRLASDDCSWYASQGKNIKSMPALFLSRFRAQGIRLMRAT